MNRVFTVFREFLKQKHRVGFILLLHQLLFFLKLMNLILTSELKISVRIPIVLQGPGGQSVNTTYSAIRLTHIPSGIVVTCQDEKSQLKNYDKALKELRTRLYNLEYQKYLDEVSHRRKTMVSTGDRSAKIRTYNYPQGRMTDHRINLTIYNLPSILDGNIQEVLDKLQMAENSERLKESNI